MGICLGGRWLGGEGIRGGAGAEESRRGHWVVGLRIRWRGRVCSRMRCRDGWEVEVVFLCAEMRMMLSVGGVGRW